MDLWNRQSIEPQEVLRWGADDRVPWRERLHSPRTLMQLAVLAGLFVCTLLVIQVPQPRLPVHKGQTAVNPILSRVYFEEENPELTGVVQALVGHQQVPRLYKPNDAPATALKEQLRTLIDEAAKATEAKPVPEAVRKAWPVDDATFAALVAAVKKAAAEKAAPEKTAPEEPGAEKAPAEKAAAAKDKDAAEPVKNAVTAAVEAIAQPQTLPIMADDEDKNLRGWLQRIEELQNKLPARLFQKDDPLLKEPAPIVGLLLPQSKEGEYQPLPMEKILRQSQVAEIQQWVAALAGPTLVGAFGEPGAKALEALLAARIGPTLVLRPDAKPRSAARPPPRPSNPSATGTSPTPP